MHHEEIEVPISIRLHLIFVKRYYGHLIYKYRLGLCRWDLLCRRLCIAKQLRQ